MNKGCSLNVKKSESSTHQVVEGQALQGCQGCQGQAGGTCLAVPWGSCTCTLQPLTRRRGLVSGK